MVDVELEEIVTVGQNPIGSVVSNVTSIREKLRSLPPRPDPLSVEEARKGLIALDAGLAQALEVIYLQAPPSGVDFTVWSNSQASKEREAREIAENEKIPFRDVVELDELYDLWQKKLKDGENQLERPSFSEIEDESMDDGDHNLAVDRALNEALMKQLPALNLTKQSLHFVPESIARITSLVFLDLSVNRLQFLPDAIAGLVNLESLNVHGNRLKHLPDSIGLLKKLRYLNVSSNQLQRLPESINGCSSLVQLNADFNELVTLPSTFGRGLDSLETLSLHLNSLSYLPATLCEVKTLKHLDVHFNKLKALPKAIGNLTNLTTVDVSSNFSDLVSLPDSIGDLTSLTSLDLSYNQIKELPLTLPRLVNLTTLKLDENPLVEPPLEVVQRGLEAVMAYLLNRWKASLLQEEQQLQQSLAMQEQSGVAGWLTGVYSNVVTYLTSPKAPRQDDFLNQNL